MEVQIIIYEHRVPIIIDPRSTLSYISPAKIEKCELRNEKQRKPWLVQLATGTKRKLTKFNEKCLVNLNGMNTQLNLNILPLGSYYVLIGMDWLESHKIILNFL